MSADGRGIGGRGRSRGFCGLTASCPDREVCMLDSERLRLMIRLSGRMWCVSAWKTSSGGTFSPRCRVSFSIFCLRVFASFALFFCSALSAALSETPENI